MKLVRQRSRRSGTATGYGRWGVARRSCAAAVDDLPVGPVVSSARGGFAEGELGAAVASPASAGPSSTTAAATETAGASPAPSGSARGGATGTPPQAGSMTAVIRSFGGVGVFLLMVPESACIPVPSELTLLFSGFAVSQGWMSFAVAVLAATAGNLVGSLLAYGLGASGVPNRVQGLRGLVERWGRLLDRHGAGAVLLARLLPLARTFVSLPAGARRVPLLAFILLTAVGCTLWAAGFVLVGELAGSAWTVVDSVVGKALLVAGVVVLVMSLARKRHLEF